MKKNIRAKTIIFCLYSLLVILAIYSGFKASDLSLLNKDNSLFISNESFKPDLSAHTINKASQGLQEYKVEFNRNKIKHLEMETLVFFLNKTTDNAYSVELNGINIGSEGDIRNGKSMFKNSPNQFSFDSKLIEDKNTLIINTYATYKSGLEADGIYISNYDVGIKQARKLDFFGKHLVIGGIGILIFSVIIMMFLYFNDKNKEIGYLYGAISTIFISIYFFDYLKIISIPYTYLTYKKIFMNSLYIAVFFYIMAMDKFLDCKKLKALSFFTALSFFIMSLFVDNIVLYKKLYTYWYFILLVNIILAFIYSFYKLKKNRQAFIFFSGFLYGSIYGSLAILIEYFDSSFSINTPLVYIVVFSALPVLFGLEEMTRKDQEIYKEKKQRKTEYINSITDNLTGAWNRRHLYNQLNERKNESILAMIDIDDFKYINDNYSHMAGDYVLCKFAEIVTSMVRQTDDVFRYGGDEFIIIFYKCSKKQVALIMEEIRRKIEAYEFIFSGQKIKITMSAGIHNISEYETIEESLKKVDEELYKAKKKGKNKISISK